MVDFTDSLFYKMRFFVVGTLIVFCLFLLPVFLSLIFTPPTAQASNSHSSTNSATASIDDNPNIIADGMFTAADNLGKSVNSTGEAIANGSHSAAATMTTAASQSGKFVARSAYSGISFVGNGMVSGLVFTGHTVGNIFGVFSKTPVVSAMIKPDDNTKVPVINPHVSVVKAAQTTPDPAVPAIQPAPQPQISSDAAWPIHGLITTNFGVPHWPYQATHTGIDISDGKRSGVTPIKPFRSGRVIQAVYSNVSLGNHVIVDHGGGITSVYGHMYSISVKVGQDVNKDTTLGTEGSTGASTGTHLHFEIRLNGQPVNPRQYVSGQP